MPQKLEDFNDGTYAPLMGNVVVDSTGLYAIDLNSLPQVLTYNSSNQVDTITVGPDKSGYYFKQTMTYTSGNLTSISAWVKQ